MACILLVDDDTDSREQLAARLADDGHALLQSGNGQQAIAMSAEQRPDLAILEVMLPGINGFETAMRLRAQAADASLPMLFVTRLTDQDTRNTALRIGADAFLSKPIDPIELKLRVRNHLTRLELTRMLEQRNLELVEAARFRDDMTSMIIHDLKNPLTVILSNVDYVAESSEVADTSSLEALRDAQLGGQRILRLIANLLDMARLEGGTTQLSRSPVRLSDLGAKLAMSRAAMAKATGVELGFDIAPHIVAHLDADLITRVIENILDNAFRHTPRGGRINISAVTREGLFEIRVGNSGPPVPREARVAIFEKYGQRVTTERGRMKLGLGLYFCRLAVEAHGGAMSLSEAPGLPTVFAMTLPYN